MRRSVSFGLFALLLAVSWTLASCGGTAPGGDEQGSGGQGEDKPADGMQDMDHRSMDRDDMSPRGMMNPSGMLMENGEYSDERFIDAMAPHHQGAVEMAQVALEKAEHPGLRQLAENIVTDQQAEIEELTAIKKKEFGSSAVPTEMSSEDMEVTGMMKDPQELASREPFDKAFIDAMIPHHVSAIQMAETAYERTSNPEIRELARGIVEAQAAEIAQITGWRREWYPEEGD